VRTQLSRGIAMLRRALPASADMPKGSG